MWVRELDITRHDAPHLSQHLREELHGSGISTLGMETCDPSLAALFGCTSRVRNPQKHADCGVLLNGRDAPPDTLYTPTT